MVGVFVGVLVGVAVGVQGAPGVHPETSAVAAVNWTLFGTVLQPTGLMLHSSLTNTEPWSTSGFGSVA